MSKKVVHLAVFASGGGSNARAILEYFRNREDLRVSVIVCNKEGAGVFEVAKAFGVPAVLVKKAELNNEGSMLELLARYEVDGIVLAGFLLLIPSFLVRAFEGKILNIHPALLPRFGGPGMHGMHVHRAVVEAGETESGPSIHLVNERYDEGAVIHQARTPIDKGDTAEAVAKKVLVLEHYWYPRVIERHFINAG
ncbi:MAG: phosphoribosylglycinamide formyltransferase [Chitinophagales bacterium]